MYERRHLLALARARRLSRRVRLVYRDAAGAATEREVDVLGLSFQDACWYACVHCHLRHAVRMLRLDRMVSAQATRRPARARAPRGFDAAFFASVEYLEPGAPGARLATIRVEGPLAAAAATLFPSAITERSGHALLCHVRASRPAVLAALVRSLGNGATLLSPRYTARHMPKVDPRAAERRLLKLAAWFLAHGPANREDVYAEFPKDYRGTDEAKEKMWTRDKDRLQRLGVPLRYSEDEDGSYQIEPGSFYLPRLTFGPAEAAVLTTAAWAALRDPDHPLREDLEAAVRKLLVGAAGLPPPRAATLEAAHAPAAPVELRKWLGTVADAVEDRKRLHLSYWVPARDEVTERDVDPYGYAWRRGEWLLVGHCHLRNTTRVFYLRRVRSLKLALAKKRAPHFPSPEAFDVRRWSRQEPWDYLAHEPRDAAIRFTGSLAKIAPRLLPGAKLATAPDNARVARLFVRNVDGLVRQCLAWGPEAELLEPAEGRTRAREILTAVTARAGEAA